MVRKVKNMVNGRILEDELKRIDDFFDAMSVEEFEKKALDCGAGIIVSSCESMYVEVLPKRYANKENLHKDYFEESMYTVSPKEIEAA